MRVELCRIEAQPVAAGDRLERIAVGRAEELSQLRDGDSQARLGSRRWLFVPELVECALVRYGLVQVKQEEGERNLYLGLIPDGTDASGDWERIVCTWFALPRGRGKLLRLEVTS